MSGVAPHFVDGGLSILQYADDTIFFMDHDIEKATNMKMLLCAFEQLSGLKIEFHIVKYFILEKLKRWNNNIRNFLAANLGSILLDIWAFQYILESLAMQTDRSLRRSLRKKLSSWKGKHMSVGGRLVLINSVLTSLTMFMLSFFEVPKGVLEKLDYYWSKFFWQSGEHKKKIPISKMEYSMSTKRNWGFRH